MRRALIAAAAVVVLLLGLGARGAFAGSVQVVAPGHLSAQTIPGASGNCWTGSLTFTPEQAVGRPRAYRKLKISGSPGAFAACSGQYADLSINLGSQQLDAQRNFHIDTRDTSTFTISLTRGALAEPVPAGTTYTLVIHS